MNLDAKRLPCRGCTANCKNYDICDGKPWKMKPNSVNVFTNSSTNKLTDEGGGDTGAKK